MVRIYGSLVPILLFCRGKGCCVKLQNDFQIFLDNAKHFLARS